MVPSKVCDKSGYNRHFAHSFRIGHKRTFVDEAEAQAAKDAFRYANGVHA